MLFCGRASAVIKSRRGSLAAPDEKKVAVCSLVGTIVIAGCYAYKAGTYLVVRSYHSGKKLYYHLIGGRGRLQKPQR